MIQSAVAAASQSPHQLPWENVYGFRDHDRLAVFTTVMRVRVFIAASLGMNALIGTFLSVCYDGTPHRT